MLIGIDLANPMPLPAPPHYSPSHATYIPKQALKSMTFSFFWDTLLCSVYILVLTTSITNHQLFREAPLTRAGADEEGAKPRAKPQAGHKEKNKLMH